MNEILVSYDPKHDILFMRFDSKKKQVDIEEPVDGVILYIAEDGSVIGLEIWDAKKRILEKLTKTYVGAKK